MLKKSLAVLLSAFMVLSMSACGQEAEPEAEKPAESAAAPAEEAKPAEARDKLVIALSSDATSLDPHYTDEGVTNSVNDHIFESLILMDKDLKNIPGLAESWELSEDGLTWTFHLRKGVKFHNGNPFTADDVIYSFDRVLRDEPTTAFGAFLVTVDSYEAPDDYTFVVKNKFEYPIFLSSVRNIRILDKETCEPLPVDQVALHPNGTGRYKLVEHVKEDHIDLVANEEYWGGAPAVKNVRFRPISNAATRTATMITGDVDLTVDIAVRDVERLENAENIEIIKQPSTRIIYLNLDGWRDDVPGVKPANPNPLKDLRVRQAMYHAIDIDTITKNVMNGHAYPAATYIPEKYNGYNPDIKRLPYDPEKAKALMKEAGYENGFEITLDAPNNRYVNDGPVAQAVASYLEKIGIKVNLNLMPKSNFFAYIKPYKNQTSFLMSGWADNAGEGVVLLKDLVYTFDGKEGYGGVNRGHYTNPEVDKLLDQAMLEADDEKRAALVQQVDKIVTDEVGYIPLHFEENLYAVKSDIKYEPRPDKSILAWDIEFK